MGLKEQQCIQRRHLPDECSAETKSTGVLKRRWLERPYKKGSIKNSAVQGISRRGSLALELQGMSKSTFCRPLSCTMPLCQRLMVTSLCQTKAKAQNVTKADTANNKPRFLHCEELDTAAAVRSNPWRARKNPVNIVTSFLVLRTIFFFLSTRFLKACSRLSQCSNETLKLEDYRISIKL
jgi:hypothetical protein